jgi:hypothetical protein
MQVIDLRRRVVPGGDEAEAAAPNAVILGRGAAAAGGRLRPRGWGNNIEFS